MPVQKLDFGQLRGASAQGSANASVLAAGLDASDGLPDRASVLARAARLLATFRAAMEGEAGEQAEEEEKEGAAVRADAGRDASEAADTPAVVQPPGSSSEPEPTPPPPHLPPANPWDPPMSVRQDADGSIEQGKHLATAPDNPYDSLVRPAGAHVDVSTVLRAVATAAASRKPRGIAAAPSASDAPSADGHLPPGVAAALTRPPAAVRADEERSARRAALHAEVQARRALAAAEKAAAEEAKRMEDEAARLATETASAMQALDRAEAQFEARERAAALEARALLHRQVTLMSKAFAGLARALELRRRREKKATLYIAAVRLEKGFRGWRDAAREWKREREEAEAPLVARADAHYARAMKARVLRAAAARVRDIAERRAALASFLRANRLADSWARWHLAAASSVGERALARVRVDAEVERRFRRAVLRPALRGWRAAAPLLRDEKEAEERQAKLLERARAMLGDL
jgi:hypothetical protein